MIPLLKIEWLKLKRYRTFWVLTGLFILCFPALTYLVYYFQTQLPRQGRILLDSIRFFQFPGIWQTAAYIGSFILILPGLLIITLITNEFVFRTHRQNIIDGWSRMQFITAKWLMVAIFTLLACGCLVLTALIFGWFTSDNPAISDVTDGISFLLYFFVVSLDYLSVAFLFGVLFKRAGLAIGLFFLYAWFIEKIVGLILYKYVENIGRFLPLASADHLIPNPLLRKIPGIKPDDTSPAIYFITALIYIAAFIFITFRWMKRSDL